MPTNTGRNRVPAETPRKMAEATGRGSLDDKLGLIAAGPVAFPQVPGCLLGGPSWSSVAYRAYNPSSGSAVIGVQERLWAMVCVAEERSQGLQLGNHGRLRAMEAERGEGGGGKSIEGEGGGVEARIRSRAGRLRRGY